MSIPKHAGLIHAFADGKTLQYIHDRSKSWVTWEELHCPDFNYAKEWRIKPDEPKKITYMCYEVPGGDLLWSRYAKTYFRLPELDYTVILPLDGD